MNSLDHTQYRPSAIPSRRQSSVIECSPRSPEITIQTISSEEYFLRVWRLISQICCSAVPFAVSAFLISSSSSSW
jgi:hypothetical protein